MEETTKRSAKKSDGQYRMYLVAVVGLVLLATAGYFGYGYFMKPATEEVAKAQQAAVQKEEVAKILAKIQKLMITPTEEPVMAKVENAEQLKTQQAFFQGATDGDYVLIFPQAAKAIIYSETRNLIVNSGPVQNQQTPTPAQTTSKVETKTEVKK